MKHPVQPQPSNNGDTGDNNQENIVTVNGYRLDFSHFTGTDDDKNFLISTVYEKNDFHFTQASLDEQKRLFDLLKRGIPLSIDNLNTDFNSQHWDVLSTVSPDLQLDVENAEFATDGDADKAPVDLNGWFGYLKPNAKATIAEIKQWLTLYHIEFGATDNKAALLDKVAAQVAILEAPKAGES